MVVGGGGGTVVVGFVHWQAVATSATNLSQKWPTANGESLSAHLRGGSMHEFNDNIPDIAHGFAARAPSAASGVEPAAATGFSVCQPPTWLTAPTGKPCEACPPPLPPTPGVRPIHVPATKITTRAAATMWGTLGRGRLGPVGCPCPLPPPRISTTGMRPKTQHNWASTRKAASRWLLRTSQAPLALCRFPGQF